MHYTVLLISVPTYVSAHFVPSSGLPSKVHNPNASGSLSQYVTAASYHHCTSLFVVIGTYSFVLLKFNLLNCWLSRYKTLKVVKILLKLFFDAWLCILVLRSILILSFCSVDRPVVSCVRTHNSLITCSDF
jgi:hypothetical protein